MKLLIAVLLPIVTTISGAPIDGYEPTGPLADNQGTSSNSVNSMDGHVQSNFPPHLSPFSLLRQRRDAPDDPVASAVERMQMIARLTNAIYLQKALINGTVKSETLISELLHFGSVTPAQIQALDSGIMEKALTALKELPSKMETDTQLAAIEKCFASVDNVLKRVKGINDVTVWPDEKSYTADIDKMLGADGVDLTLISDLKEKLEAWGTFHRETVKVKDKNPLESTDAHFLSMLGAKSKDVLDIGTSLTKTIPKIFEFTNKKTAASTVNFVDKLTTAVSQLKAEKFKVPTERYFQSLQKNLDHISAASKEISNVQPSLEYVRTMFSSRVALKGVKPPTYTLSLPRGYDDITRMHTHFTNLWFAEAVKDKRLGDSFKSLISLEAAKLVDAVLEENGGSKQKFGTMQNLVEIATHLKAMVGSYSLNNAKAITGCINIPNTIIYDDDVKNLVTYAGQIDEELEKLQNTLVKLRDSLTKPEFVQDLGKIVEIGAKSDEDQQATWKPAFDQFNRLTNLNEIQNSIEEISKLLDGKNEKALLAHANATKPLLPSVNTFLTKHVGFTTTLNCLIKNPATLPTIQVIADSKDLRNKRSQHEATVSNALDVVKSVDATKKDLKALDTIIKGIKNIQSLESDLLYNLTDSDKIYSTIGSSVRAIESMKLAIDSKSKIDVIKAESDTVASEVANAKADNKLSEEDEDLLNKLPTLGASLDTIYPKLNTWVADVKALSLKNLSDFGNVFMSAKGVTGINEDLVAIGSSLEKLIEVADSSKAAKLRKVKDALDSLDGMGIQFASYSKNLDDTTKSLTALDLFFSSFAQTISATLPPPAPKVFIQNNNDGSNSSNAQPDQSQTTPVWAIVTIVVLALLVLGLIATGFVFWKKYKKLNDDRVAEELDKPKDPKNSAEKVSEAAENKK